MDRLRHGFDTLSKAYRPITSTAFDLSGGYREIMPSDPLKPYIRCFWENKPGKPEKRLVIPDTCMDIIINIDNSRHTAHAVFCTMDEHTYQSGAAFSTFGIRFFGHTAALFSQRDFCGTKNRTYFPDEFFEGITDSLIKIVERHDTLLERARAAEALLINRLDKNRVDSDFMNAISGIILNNGRIGIRELARRNGLSERKLERIFANNVGVSPKTLSNLIRYQFVWQDIVRGGDILDMVEKYGYTDQSHLLNDFRLRHGMNPKQAVISAHVGFLQDKPENML